MPKKPDERLENMSSAESRQSELPLYTVPIVILRQWVRNGEYPDNHTILSVWLKRDGCCDKASYSIFCQSCSYAHQWASYEQQVKLLTDTMTDELIAKQWRISCVNNVCYPLLNLKRLIRDDFSNMAFRYIEYQYWVNYGYITNTLC